MKDPLLSIIIPTYNDCVNLKKNIRSILTQSFDSYEIIIINDCSTDDTNIYLATIDNKRIFYENLSQNKGPGYARNIGIKKARGKWISFLDSDDGWSDSRLVEISKAIKNNDQFDIFCHNEIQINKINNQQKKLSYGPLNFNDSYKDLLINGNRFSTSATIIKKDYLDKYDLYFNEKKSFFSVEDYDFWLRCIFHGARFRFINLYLGYYFIHGNNITNNILKHKKITLEFCIFILLDFKNLKIIK